jgi:hypothetical protein
MKITTDKTRPDQPELAEPAPFVAGIEPKHPTSSFETIDKDSTAAPLRLGRVVAEPSDPMPPIRLPAPRWSPNPAERSAVLGLFVQPNLASPPAEPERTTKHNAAVLIDAARDRKLVDVYDASREGRASFGHVRRVFGIRTGVQT